MSDERQDGTFYWQETFPMSPYVLFILGYMTNFRGQTNIKPYRFDPLPPVRSEYSTGYSDLLEQPVQIVLDDIRDRNN